MAGLGKDKAARDEHLGMKLEKLERAKKFRLHLVARKVAIEKMTYTGKEILPRCVLS